jgi:hypothetical protein
LALFRNDTNAQISLTTNTGLTLHPSPLLIPANSSIRVIFEVVGSTYATAAFNVYVENGGGGANAPNSIVVAANGGLVSNLSGNTYTVSPDLQQAYGYTTTGPVVYNDTTNTLSTFGTWSQRDIGGSLSGPSTVTTTMQNIIVAGNVTTPWASYNGSTGVLTATVAQNVDISASVISSSVVVTAGGTNPTVTPPGGTLFMTIVKNGLVVATSTSTSGTISINLTNYTVAAGDTLSVQVGISTGTMTAAGGGGYLHFGVASG